MTQRPFTSGTLRAISDPENEYSAVARKMEDIFLHGPLGYGKFRTQTEIEALFPGLDMVHPGVVLAANWWPDGPRIKPLNRAQATVAAGIGREP